MTERESYRRIFSPLAEKRIQNNKCPNCGKPKLEWTRRTSWRCCSTKCTKEFWIEHDKSWSWDTFRLQVFRRDKGICQMCKKKFTFIGYYEKKEIPDYSRLIADHINPLAIDGKMWDINNLQTLCLLCNKIKTKQDMKDIANYKNGKLKIRTKQLVID